MDRTASRLTFVPPAGADLLAVLVVEAALDAAHEAAGDQPDRHQDRRQQVLERESAPPGEGKRAASGTRAAERTEAPGAAGAHGRATLSDDDHALVRLVQTQQTFSDSEKVSVKRTFVSLNVGPFRSGSHWALQRARESGVEPTPQPR